jgi:hypothetical protein
MKTKLLLLASAISALLLPSCFQHETTITLNKDGSGTLVEESRLGAQMLAMMSQMAEGFGGGDGGEKAGDPLKEMFSEDKAKARAAELGEGVTYEKSEPVEANGSKGAKVTYRFKDINTLKVRSGDGMKSMSPGPAATELDAAAKKEEPVTFAYQDGKLTIKLPQPEKDGEKPAGEAAEKPDMENPQAMEMMKQMFADMKMGIKLVIAPGIAETTATHKEGDTITLMEMDFGKLIEKPENLKKMAAMDEKDPTAAMEALKGVEGVKFEAKPEITVTLK